MAHEERGLTVRLAGEIARTYAVHQKVLASVLRPFAELKADASDIRIAKFKIREIVRRLDVYAVTWVRGSISVAYKAKRAEIEPLAKRAAVFVIGEKADPSKVRIARRAETAARDFLKANRTIEKTAAAFLSAFEQAIGAVGTAEARTETQFMAADMGTEMARKSKYYLSRGYDAQSISRKLRQYLEKLVDGKDFIEVAGRFYNLKAYAEMVARSELHDTYVDATLDECAKYDCDLVQFSRHANPCPICATLEGKVFSISGDDEEFPSLNELWEVEVQTKTEIKTVMVDPKRPHQNCEHSFNPVTRNILRASGELG